jgi:ubiquinone/menaquinone biosynthesis C-methylase UbiE
MTLQRDPERNEIKALQRAAEFEHTRVLEVGCGEGRLTWRYAAKASQVVAIDNDLDGLRIARIDRPQALAKSVHLAGASARNLPFPREKFDLAVFSWSL